MNYHGGYHGEKKQIVDLSVNTNSFIDLSEERGLLLSEWEKMTKYPEIEGETAKNHIAAHHQIDANQLILGNGATEIIYLYAQQCKGKKVLLLSPTFSEYERALALYGADIYKYDMSQNNFEYQWDSIMRYIKNVEIDILFICNPNNPTGMLIKDQAWEGVLKELDQMGVQLFVDESFIYFTEETGLLAYTSRYKIFVLRSITKIFHIPGIRIGYGVGNKAMVEKMLKYKQPWTLNALALLLAERYEIMLEKSESGVAKIAEERAFIEKSFQAWPQFKLFPGKANFFMVKGPKGFDVAELNVFLLEKRFFVRDCSSFRELNERYFRFSVQAHDVNVAFMELLEAYIAEHQWED